MLVLSGANLNIALPSGMKAMNDRIFYKGLERQLGNKIHSQLLGNIQVKLDMVLISNLLQLHVALQMLHFAG
ncbi:hypothetical protein D3C78_934400 [compost metagenome]